MERIIYEDNLCQVIEQLSDDDPPQLAGYRMVNKVGSVGYNRDLLKSKARAALAVNNGDIAADQTIQEQAATITGSTGTLTTAQLSSIVRQLAQGLSVLAGNDVNSKRELTALGRLAAEVLDSTDGT